MKKEGDHMCACRRSLIYFYFFNQTSFTRERERAREKEKNIKQIDDLPLFSTYLAVIDIRNPIL